MDKPAIEREALLAPERRRKIAELLGAQEFVTHAELLAVTGTSIATLRRDLHLLERSGALRRIRGGATRPRTSRIDSGGEVAQLLAHAAAYLRSGDLEATEKVLRRALNSCEHLRAVRRARSA